MTTELFVNGELTLIRTETHGKRKKTKSEPPIFTSRMEKREYYKSFNYFDIRNVIDVKGLLQDIHTNLHTYVSKVNEWVQNSPVKKLVVTGIFTVMLGVFSNTANAAFIQEYTYQVKNGEKIENIASAHGVTAQEILEANGLSSIEGKKILLPKVQNQTVTATKLNIRSQPSTVSSIIGQYQKGDVVKVTFVENGWAAILIKGRVCFVSAEYLTDTEINAPSGDQNSITTNPQTKTTMYVTASSLRVRQAAATTSAVLGSLKLNDGVSVTSIGNGWAQIIFNGKKAYVSETYLSKIEPTRTGTSEYVIKSGDTFTKISKAFGISISSLQGLNPTVDPAKLKIGQKIKVPATTSPDTKQIKVTAHIAGIEPGGTFRFITSDGITHAAKASGNMLNELFSHQGKKLTLTFEGNRGQVLTLKSLQ